MYVLSLVWWLSWLAIHSIFATSAFLQVRRKKKWYHLSTKFDGARSYFSKFSFMFHLKNHHFKHINLNFTWIGQTGLMYEAILYIAVAYILLCKVKSWIFRIAEFLGKSRKWGIMRKTTFWTKMHKIMPKNSPKPKIDKYLLNTNR